MSNRHASGVFRFFIIILTLMLVCSHSVVPVYADEIFIPFVSQAETMDASGGRTTTVSVVVQLVPGTSIVAFSADYQVTYANVIPSLLIYRLQGNDSRLLTNVSADPRVVWAVADQTVNGFDAQTRTYATGDFEMLQRYFGFGSGDSSGTIGSVERAIVVKSNDNFDVTWKTWGVLKTRANQAHNWATGDGIVVAVLDTGVDLDHPVLVERLKQGYDFVDGDTLPNDAPNGVDDDRDRKVDEGAGHGTHVTGIITSVAPDAKVMPVRVLNSDGVGTVVGITQGIIYAVDQGADVINLSLKTTVSSPLLEAAISYARSRQVIVIAAANGTQAALDYPGAYPAVITVGATRLDDAITDFSLPYAALVDVFAPGELIYSTYYDGAFAWWSGTSMAAPFVAGEAALLLQNDDCPADCVINIIGREVSPVSPSQAPRGRIEMVQAVRAIEQ